MPSRRLISWIQNWTFVRLQSASYLSFQYNHRSSALCSLMPTVFWLCRHELKDYLRNINICCNDCLCSYLEQIMPHPEKEEFRIKKSNNSCSRLQYRLLLNSQSRQKPQKIVSISYSEKKILIRIFLFSAPNSNAYWDVVGLKWKFKTNYQ